MIVNVLWPFVPAAIVMRFARPDLHVWVFTLNYIAMVPTANLLGFAGGELARKLPRVYGILFETSLTSIVEVILFMVLIKTDSGGNLISVIQAAILGSILANLLLCLGMCFFFGGMRRDEQILHEAVSEVGSGLLLVAGFGLLIPSAFYATLEGTTTPEGPLTPDKLESDTRIISRATAIILLCAYLMYVFTCVQEILIWVTYVYSQVPMVQPPHPQRYIRRGARKRRKRKSGHGQGAKPTQIDPFREYLCHQRCYCMRLFIGRISSRANPLYCRSRSAR
jgi:calcium/proton exchanger cax